MKTNILKDTYRRAREHTHACTHARTHVLINFNIFIFRITRIIILYKTNHTILFKQLQKTFMYLKK